MTKLICTMPSIVYEKFCGGEIEKNDIYFCKGCIHKKIKEEIISKNKKPKCSKCEGEIMKAKEYICKECKTIFDLVEIEA